MPGRPNASGKSPTTHIAEATTENVALNKLMFNTNKSYYKEPQGAALAKLRKGGFDFGRGGGDRTKSDAENA